MSHWEGWKILIIIISTKRIMKMIMIMRMVMMMTMMMMVAIARATFLTFDLLMKKLLLSGFFYLFI